MILTAKTGNNCDIFPDVLSMYAKQGDTIADVTYGTGKFWKNIDQSHYKILKSDIVNGIDFRKLPYSNDAVDMVVLDPPYIYNPKKTVKSSISNTYNINLTDDLRTNEDVMNLYEEGIIEAKRVLKPKGVLVLKCQDIIQSNRQNWNHIEIYNIATVNGFYGEDLFVLVQSTIPCQRWKIQRHARKNHSYFWVFRK